MLRVYKAILKWVLKYYPAAHIASLDRSYCAFVIKSRSIADRPKEEALLGLPAEVGELISLYQKHYRKLDSAIPIDRAELLSELGDVFYYFIAIMKMENFTLNQVMDNNIKKICERNPGRSDLQSYKYLFKGK